jgi:phage terminase large subunit-like protein
MASVQRLAYYKTVRDGLSLVETGKFRFDDNPMLTWMASNCVVDRRVNGTILPKKENQDSPKKIDGIDALIMALGGANAGSNDRSHYDTAELRFV